uniref:Uncharacterized protein n=1 Tax=Anguilla anguilla TaxID=7936 RepID=A0A0E9QMT0_ANGAN
MYHLCRCLLSCSKQALSGWQEGLLFVCSCMLVLFCLLYKDFQI